METECVKKHSANAARRSESELGISNNALKSRIAGITRTKTIATVMVAMATCLMFAATTANAYKVKLDTALGSSVLLAGKKQTTYLKVGLTGFALERESDRAPVNLAIVLDKSGSMQGEKIAKAREAAIMAISRLNSEDIVSFIVYDSTVRVIIPATKLTDRESVFNKIRNIQAGGSTALFGGVSKGAEEVRKFFSSKRVNHIILLSDGLANIGPQSPSELGRLGASLGKEGVTVSTIGLGLGYNEDLMAKLAFHSDGNHFFVENAMDLASIFDKEFGKAMSVVAQKIKIEIKCARGIRPVRVLGREADIVGQKVYLTINHLYSDYHKYLILEIESAPTEHGTRRKMADVRVRYKNMTTETTDNLASIVTARFSSSKKEVERHTNNTVMADAIELIAVERSQMAATLRRKGKVKEAQKVFSANSFSLQKSAKKYKSKKLEGYAAEQLDNSVNLDEKNWRHQGKSQSQSDVFRTNQ